MAHLASVLQAQYRGAHRIHLLFDDGAAATLNFLPWLRGPVFEPLRDLDFFRRFFVDGGTVTWPNGADIAPETLRAAAGRARPNKALQPSSRAPRKAKPTQRSRAARG